jgi:hypothetical protein
VAQLSASQPETRSLLTMVKWLRGLEISVPVWTMGRSVDRMLGLFKRSLLSILEATTYPNQISLVMTSLPKLR